MQVAELFVESKRRPLGVDVLQPAFGWSFADSPIRLQMQTAYRIIVINGEDDRRSEIVWDSGQRFSKKNVHILYEGPPLQSRQRYYWKVQVWDANGHKTESPVSWWEMGLLHATDWSATWIARFAEEPLERPALPLIRREFHLHKPVAQARAYICGLGQFELRLNGEKVSDNVLEPGWTNYDKTCLYCVYDVTEQLHEGGNAIGVMLGNGFFHVTGGRYSKFKHSFGTPRCLVQLEITHTDGTQTRILSDRHWDSAPGPITFSCIYGGEDYDANHRQADWDLPSFTGNDTWNPAVEVPAPAGKLKSQATSPLKVMETYLPVQITQPLPGVYVADFGKNFSGWMNLQVRGPQGAKITMSPAELLKDNGTINQKWTGSPTKFTYTLSGDAEGETWSPRFSYTGFRYVQLEGVVPVSADADANAAACDSDIPDLIQLEGQMIYPDVNVCGNFVSSNKLLNRTHEIINQAIRSNMKSIFTDCPHREKLGWLEQIHLMGPSVAWNYDVEPLFIKTMEDIRDAQLPSGMVPTTAPEYVVFSDQWRCFRDSVSWGATYILTGWNLLQFYGNHRILTEHYEGMKAYIDYLKASSDQLIIHTGLGDWYDVGDNPPGFVQNTPVAHTETAMFYHIVDVFAQIAKFLNRSDDALHYTQLREDIKSAFNQAFFDDQTQQYATGSQSSQAMPLVLGLAHEPYKETILAGLLDDITLRGYHTTAGDIGHRYVLLALSQNGRSDMIYKMSQKTDHPSYGYQIANGATSLTEAWDGPTVGKSQNHFMLGHLEEWLYSGLAGLQYRYCPDFESYKLTIKPALLDDLDEVAADYRLPSGKLRVAWRRNSGERRLKLAITIPANCLADVHLPSISRDTLLESGIPLKDAAAIQEVMLEDGDAVIRLGSGSYLFECEV
ncbi:family 78 glycoside hydrolase catalytic domain [Paenibacillus sp. P36]|uniref:family 78 glycoside hydrolase catalytic domain n=1 Tax=Paenibacillus sp. P36 TaxID=3342538 RepID=UPI0038B32B9A